jgi:hypothetical protein
MIFEKATRMKLRFTTTKGKLITEDLWDLNLKQLNTLAKSLNKELKESKESDFLEEENKEDIVLKLKFDIVLYILNTKKAELNEHKDFVLKKANKAKLLDILAKKQDAALENLSEEELKKKIDELM